MPPMKTAAAIKKSSLTTGTENPVPKTMTKRTTRVSTSLTSLKKENMIDVGPFAKRKAASPIKGNTLKRTALVNITNAIESQCVITSGKKPTRKNMPSTVTKPTISTAAKATVPVSTVTAKSVTSHSPQKALKSMLPPLPKSRLTLPPKSGTVPVTQSKQSIPGSLRTVPVSSVKPCTVTKSAATVIPVATVAPTDKSAAAIATRSSTRQSPTVIKKQPPVTVPVNKCKITAKPKCTVNPAPRRSSGRRSTLDSDSSLYVSALSEVLDETPEPLPAPNVNIDEEYAEDPFQCATYAKDIFEYLKSREEHFKIKDYIAMQTGLSQHIRAILVDWMVEIQENFELNHETLYLGVKLVDKYLSHIKVSKQSLQLVGATAMLIACKYDERCPPSIEDFLYICDGAYRHKDITKMEINMLRIANFELGFPLSYRFLRRYARCAKVPMPLLTLARYILEFTLMDYSTVCLSDSKMAAAALYLAFKMKKEQQWDNTLIHFTGYRVQDFIEIAHILNNSIHQKPRQSLATVRNKYSHKIFYEVAQIPLISNSEL